MPDQRTHQAIETSKTIFLSTEKRRARWAMIIVGLVGFCVYANNLKNNFIMDDHFTVVSNEEIRSLRNIPRMFSHGWGEHAPQSTDRLISRGYFRPMSSLFFAMDYAIWGLHPAGYHLTNNLFHALVCVFVLLLLLRLTKDLFIGLCGGILFALHPIHTEAVNVISYRTELLASLFCVIALSIHLGAGSRTLRDWLWLPFLFALGLASKETAAVLPIYLLLTDIYLGRCRLRQSGKAYLALAQTYGPLLLVALIFFVLRFKFLGAPVIHFFGDLSPALLGLSVMKIYLTYIRLIFFPWPLTPFWDWTILAPASSLTDAEALAGLFAMLATLGLMVLLIRKCREAALALVFWCFGLLPFLHFVPLPVGAAERFLYLPSIGIALLIGFCMRIAINRFAHRGRVLVMLFALLLCALMSVGTMIRNTHWETNTRLWQQAARDFPDSFYAHYMLGFVHQSERRLENAILEFRAADKILPNIASNVGRLGRALIDVGRIDEARRLLDHTKSKGITSPMLRALEIEVNRIK